MTTDNSVLMNINDLFEMERDRRVATAAAVERDEAEATARQERDRREREEALRQVGEDERRRAREEAAARSEAVEGRIASLRAKLAEVRFAREQMSLEVAALANRPAPASNRANWIVGAMTAVSLVAAVTATFVSWPHPTAPVATVPAIQQIDEIPLDDEAPIVDEVIIVAADAIDEATVTDEAPDVASDSRPAVRAVRAVPRHQEGDLAHQLDFGGDDGLIPDP